MINIKLSFIKSWGINGTCYDQRVKISKKDFCFLEKKLKRASSKNYYKNLYLKTNLEKIDNVVYCNLTQKDFFNKYLGSVLKDRNTYFYIVEEERGVL